ncbi:MAG: EAL domain-containing protein [Rhizobiaceae bacterium]|nr:EAL domain-containing protein [Rhizobiaceae bacterium]
MGSFLDFPVPDNEDERLANLSNLDLIGGPAIDELDALVDLVADSMDCPSAVVSLLDEDFQWFKARVNLDANRTDRKDAFCNYTIDWDGVFVVENALEDPRFRENPLVTGLPGIRAYAGCAITIDGKHPLGALCVLDYEPRSFTDAELARLEKFKLIVESIIRGHENSRRATSAIELVTQKERESKRNLLHLEKITAVSGVGGWELTLADGTLTCSEQTKIIHDTPPDFVPSLEEAIKFYQPEARDKIQIAVEAGISEGIGWDLELPLTTYKGAQIWTRAVGEPIFSDGEVTGLMGTFQDITQQRVDQNRLRDSEALARERSEELDVTLANMKQGVSVFDSSGNLLLWNQKYIDIFEKPEGEIHKGVSLRDLILSEKARGDFSGDVDAVIDDLNAGLNEGKTVRKQFELKSGRIISSVHAAMPGGGWVGTHDDITLQEKNSRQIAHAAHHDPLTGLANRTKFNLEVAEAMQRSKTRDHQAAVMLIDLDGFKLVNDGFGHNAGDELLIGVGKRLVASVRPHDLVARLGGDEFAIVLDCEPDTTTPIHDIAERILTALELPFLIGPNEILISASIGVSFIEDDDNPVETALGNADCALYKIKEEGKRGYRVFDLQINMEVAQKRVRELALREVTKNKNFQVHYQPIQRMTDNQVSGFEALIRWDNDDYETQYPDEFIPLAEDLGLINEIGNWVIETSIAEAKDWPDDLRLALNVSPRQLGRGHLHSAVKAALENNQFTANRLELEITEYAMIQDDESTISELQKLKDLGVRIVLDDFGTGYSSLSYLHRFPFDKLKIDRSFINGFETNDRRANIIRAIVSMAVSLGIEVTAEGIETEDQLLLLRLMGCTFAQGYYFSKPRPAHEFALLSDYRHSDSTVQASA